VFVTKKAESEDVHHNLVTSGHEGMLVNCCAKNGSLLCPETLQSSACLTLNAFPPTAAVLIHGDMDQDSRTAVLGRFKRQEVRVLVATDVAGKSSARLSSTQPASSPASHMSVTTNP
jgi:superfamily II DNA/RNA helicase